MTTAILMAAGMGTRISRDIRNNCKCTLDIGGNPLIRYSVKLLLERGIEVHIVVGYEKERVYKALEGLPVIFHENIFYSITNSLVSLWFAKDAIKGDRVILGNADVYWEKTLLDILMNEEKDNVMLCDSTRVEAGDYLFRTQDEILYDFGKGNDCYGANSEYVGLSMIQGELLNKFKERLDELVVNQHHNYWWEQVLYSMVNEITIWTKDIAGNFWAEIDYIEDYERILEYRKNEKKCDFGFDTLL